MPMEKKLWLLMIFTEEDQKCFFLESHKSFYFEKKLYLSKF